jgi:hypothetical protein
MPFERGCEYRMEVKIKRNARESICFELTRYLPQRVK